MVSELFIDLYTKAHRREYHIINKINELNASYGIQSVPKACRLAIRLGELQDDFDEEIEELSIKHRHGSLHLNSNKIIQLSIPLTDIGSLEEALVAHLKLKLSENQPPPE